MASLKAPSYQPSLIGSGARCPPCPALRNPQVVSSESSRLPGVRWSSGLGFGALPSLQGPSRLKRHLGQQCDYHPPAEPSPHPLLQPEVRLYLEPGGDTRCPAQTSHTLWQPRYAHAWGLLFLALGPGLAEPAGDRGVPADFQNIPTPPHTPLSLLGSLAAPLKMSVPLPLLLPWDPAQTFPVLRTFP